MIAWRILREVHSREPLSGFGASLAGGRWNSKGVPVVYAATSLSLCILELLAAYLPTGRLPPDLVAAKLELPDDLPALEPAWSDLPSGWKRSARPPACQRFGDRWVKTGKSAVLIVPSATITARGGERNVILNPVHENFGQVRHLATLDLELDERLKPAGQ